VLAFSAARDILWTVEWKTDESYWPGIPSLAVLVSIWV